VTDLAVPSLAASFLLPSPVAEIMKESNWSSCSSYHMWI